MFDGVADSVARPTEIPDNWLPSPKYFVAVHTPANSACPSAVIVPPTPARPNLIPALAVMTPTESTLVTSSYVRTPVNVAATPVKFLIVISGVPVNPWALVATVATVAVAEFPVHDPEEPLASPASAPLKVVADNVFVPEW